MKQNLKETGLVRAGTASFWRLTLYIAQGAFDAECVIQNVLNLCSEHLPGNYSLELVDPTQDPKRAVRDEILTFPTLIRSQPHPLRRIVGADLSDPNRILSVLQIKDIVSG